MNDAPDVVEEFLLFGRAPRAREGVAGVAGEAAGEVSARGRLVRAGHAYLVAVVELRHAARREDEGVREFRASDGRAPLAHEAPVVVAADERDEQAGVRVEVILRERLRDLLVVLIEVGQEIQEPSLQRLATALLLGVWVVEHPCLEEVLEVVCARAVIPSGRRAVVNPRMIRARVIANLVLYYFNAELVCVVNEFA